MPSQFGAAHADANAIIALGQRADDMPPQKTRSAEHCDEGIDGRWHVDGPEFEKGARRLRDFLR